jgi:DNA replication and repair protein RecF
MILDQLSLQQFRSYVKTTFTFSPKTTLIIGVNTAGKTNILEAIYFLATGKSFRADADREVIRWDAEIARIKAIGDETKLEILLTQGLVSGAKAPLKKYLVNGVARRMIDFVGNLRAVLFWPEHLELITDSPSIRRKYLDSVLIQVDREYRRNLMSYERGLRQRNRLLDLINEGKAHRHQLLFWNQLLIKSGSYITDARAAFIDFVNNYKLTNLPMNQLTYDKSVISEARLDQYALEEVSAKATLVGPHRDDIQFVICDKRHVTNKTNTENVSHVTSCMSLSSYGSRGEQRLAVLWLKLAEVSFIEHTTGERPILLLDDIFSELDEKHREFVLGIIGKQQTIITTAEEDVLSMLKREKTNINLIHLDE